MRIPIFCIPALAIAVAAGQAAAELTASGDGGFTSHHQTRVGASPAEVWDALIRPSEWWSGEHTYSGSAANLTLVPAAGGCFCEAIPAARGEIEHMRVIYAAPGATLRLTGGLGPLQSEAVVGVLTVTLAPAGDGTTITWDYVVGGYARTPLPELAPLVDKVIDEQLNRLAANVR